MIHEIKYFERERSAYYVTIIINFHFSRYFSSKNERSNFMCLYGRKCESYSFWDAWNETKTLE